MFIPGHESDVLVVDENSKSCIYDFGKSSSLELAFEIELGTCFILNNIRISCIIHKRIYES